MFGDKLCEGLPEVFKKFVQMIINLKFDEAPDHQKLIDILLEINARPGKVKPTLEDIDVHSFNWNELIQGGEKGFQSVTVV